jgi:diguanylate cyclase (GGDEF)-like protein
MNSQRFLMQVLLLFDVRTVAILIAMTFLAQATIIGAQAFLIKELRQYQGIGPALVANLCMAIGLILRLFVDQLPHLVVTILADFLLMLGPGLFYIALSQFTGLSYSKTLVVSIILGVLSGLLYFTYGEYQAGVRMAALSAGVVILIALLIYQLWRTRKTSLRFSADLMLASFSLYGIFLIGRTSILALYPLQEEYVNTPIQSLTYLMSFAISFFWSTGFILMISQRLKNDLMEVATMDMLTRIPNRRATQSFLEKELARIQRTGSQFSVLLIDIDNFKQVNDRWGHSMGDKVLIKTANIFQVALRKQDWVGRWGGEEFLVILPGSPYCDSEALADRLRHEIANSEHKHAHGAFHITVSIGVACAHPDSTLDEILKKADKALYSAKRVKNAVSVAD